MARYAGNVERGAMKRKSYSPVFKSNIGLEGIKGVMTGNDIGTKYEGHLVQISQWKKALLANVDSIFDGKSPKEPTEVDEAKSSK
jgi:transposase